MLKSLLIKITAILIGAILLFRLLSISEGISVSIRTTPEPELDRLLKVVKSNPNHAYAHEQIAWHEYHNKKYDVAKSHALKALSNNPSSGLAMSILMMIFNEEKNTEKAEQAAQLSAHLWPAHDVSMWMIADYQLRNQQMAKAMSAWNATLSQQPLGEKFSSHIAVRSIFPILNKIAQHADSAHLFQPYHAKPPTWWDEFFQYMVVQPDNLEAVDRFYQQALLNGHSSIENKKRYLSNLIIENEWPKARRIWENGLTGKKEKFTGLIYDGGFESKYINDEFNWIITNMDHVQVYFDTYSRAEGARSLRVAFNTWIDDYWSWIRQFVVLPPGNYTIQFQTRANLDSQKGVKWLLGCYQNDTEKIQRLGESASLSGDFQWRTETFNLTVPESSSCKAQKLYLVSAGHTKRENRMRGDIWFDDFKITKNN